MVVGHEVRAGTQPRDRRDLVDGVGLLHGHRATDPRRRADDEVGLVVEHRTRPDRGGMEVRGPGHHDDAGRQAEIVGDRLPDLADDRAGADEGRELLGRDAGALHQDAVVGEVVGPAVVGQPRRGHRRVGGGGHAGEPHRQVVDRLHVPPRPSGHLGLLVLEVEHVPDRVRPGGGGGAAAVSDPAPQGERGVSHHGPTHRPPGVGAAAVVHPHEAVTDGDAVLRHRDRARPLSRARDGHDPVAAHRAARHGPAGGVRDHLPPLLGVLDRAAAGEQPGAQCDVVAPRDRAGERHEADLGPARPEVDGEDEPLVPWSGHPSPGTCW